MSRQALSPQPTQTTSSSHAPGRVLQRKCACGAKSGTHEQCAECAERAKYAHLQRSGTGQFENQSHQPTVTENLPHFAASALTSTLLAKKLHKKRDPKHARPVPQTLDGTWIRRIDVDLTTQTMTLTYSDKTPPRSLNISSGKGLDAAGPEPCKAPQLNSHDNCTPPGRYKALGLYGKDDMKGMPWFVRFNGKAGQRGIGIHQGEVRGGIPESHGCIRVPTLADAEHINKHVTTETDIFIDGEAPARGKSTGKAGPNAIENQLERRADIHPTPDEVPSIVYDVLRSPGAPLDAATRDYMEPRFGHDFSHVRVHTDAQAAQSARAVSALAYTVGRDVVFAAGQHAPGTTAGRQLMAHELTHVVQHRGEWRGNSIALGDEDALESLALEVERSIGSVNEPSNIPQPVRSDVRLQAKLSTTDKFALGGAGVGAGIGALAGGAILGPLGVLLGGLVGAFGGFFAGTYLSPDAGRGLSEPEKKLAWDYFGNSIDLECVRVVHASLIDGFALAVTPYETIYVPNTAHLTGHMPDDLLLHELTHVWQYQNKVNTIATRALTAWFGGSGAYDYGGPAVDRTKLHAGDASALGQAAGELNQRRGRSEGVFSLGSEEQGALMQDYVLRQCLSSADPFCLAARPYIDEIKSQKPKVSCTIDAAERNQPGPTHESGPRRDRT